MRTRTPEEAQLVVVDYRRVAARRGPRRATCSTTSPRATQADAGDRATSRRTSSSRLPGPDVTPDQLRNRSWWTGAEVFVLVDDYDLVATQQGSPVAAAAAAAGPGPRRRPAPGRWPGAPAARPGRSYEPVIQRLRDLAMPGLLLSGSPDEGPLIGTVKPAPAVPGRGRLVTRDRGVEVVQTAWTDPTL